MSSTVEQRVVEMRFDNQQFERNVQTSMNTLDKLKQKLNSTDSAKGLEEVSKVASKINFSNMSSGLETVKVSFSALETVAFTVLQRITNSAITTGEKITSALTINPLKMGFSEYETQINAVQTILANTSSKGTTLDQVNDALDELNHYADMTIYNFTEMTKNIGTFTAAGVDLDTSVSAIKGIANLAAVSGSTSQQASTAMYQLSQALASGTVKLQDWNSVVNAGMGGQVFQDALKETARVHGIAIDEMITKEGSFRETLSEGWLTSSILTETLAKFTGDLSEEELKAIGYTEEQIAEIQELGETANDAATKVKTFTQLKDTLSEALQSGWTQTWENIVGDFEEAKSLFTDLSDIFSSMIEESANARNSLLEGALGDTTAKFADWAPIKSFLGMDDTAAMTKALTTVAKDHGIAIEQMIEDEGSFDATLKNGWLTDDIFDDVIEDFDNLSAEELKNKGYTDDEIRSLRELSATLQESGNPLNELYMNLSKLNGREVLIDILHNSFNALMSVVVPIKEAFREIFPSMTSDQLYSLIVKVNSFVKSLQLTDEQSAKLKLTFKGLFAILDIGKQAVSALFSGFKSLLGGLNGIGDGILNTTSTWGAYAIAIDRVLKETDFFNTAVTKLISLAKSGLTVAISAFQALGDAVEMAYGYLRENFNFPSLTDLYNALGSLYQRFTDICAAIQNFKLDFTGAFKAAGDSINSSGLIGFFAAIGQGLATIGKSLVSIVGTLASGFIKGLGSGDFSGIFDLINSLSLGGIAAGLFKFFNSTSKSVKSFSGMFDGFKEIMEQVTGCFKTFQDSLKAKTLLTIASAIGILAASLVVLASIDSGKLSGALVSITALFSELLGAMAVFNKISGGAKSSTKNTAALVAMAVAVAILTASLKSLSSLEMGGIVQGLVGIGGSMAILVVAVNNLTKNNSKLVKGTTGLIAMAVALRILVSACKSMASLSWEEMGKGLVGVAGMMAEIVVFTNLMKNTKQLVSIGTAMVGISTGLVIMSAALKILATMSWEEIGRGLTVLAGTLTAVTIALNLMPKNMLTISAGLLAVSAGLVVMAAALKIMATMTWGDIGQALVVLGGAMLILAVGLNAMKSTLTGSAALLVAAAAISILAPALAIIGALSWESLAKGFAAVAGAFVIFGVAGLVLSPLVPVIIALAGALALVGVAVLSLGAGVLAAGVGLTALSAGLVSLSTIGPAAVASIIATLSLLTVGIISLIPTIATAIAQGIVTFATAIAAGAPELAAAVVTIITAIITVLNGYIPQAVDCFGNLLTSLLQTIAKYTPSIVQAFLTIITSFLSTLAANLPSIIQAGVDIIVALLQGIASASVQIVDAAFQMIIDFINGLADSIRVNMPLLLEAVGNLATAIIEGLVDGLGLGIDKVVDCGKNLMEGLIEGIKGHVEKVVTAAKDMANNVLSSIKNVLGINSPSWKTDKYGRYTDEGMAQGIKAEEDIVVDAAEEVAEATGDAMQDEVVEEGEETTDTIDEVGKGIVNQIKDYAAEAKAAATEGTSSVGKTNWWENYLEDMDEEDSDTTSSTTAATEANEELASSYDSVSSSASSASSSASEATDAFEEMADSIESNMDIFSEFEEVEKVSAGKLLSNMSSQLTAVSSWADDIAKMTAMGFEESLVQKLAEAGTSSWGEVKGFLEMTASQVQVYNLLYEKSIDAPIAAVEKLKEALPTLTQTVAEETGKTVDQVGHSTDEVTDSIEEVTETVEETGETVEDTTKEIQNDVEETAEDTDKSISMSIDAMEDLTETTEGLTEITEDATEQFSDINEVMEQTAESTSISQEQIDKLNAELGDTVLIIPGITEVTTEMLEQFVIATAQMQAKAEDFKSTLSETIESQIDLFSEFDKETELSSATLISNMQSQINGVTQWADMLSKLGEKGVSEGLLEKLRDLGPDGYEYVHAFYEMTASEVEQANNLFAQSLTLPDTLASYVTDSFEQAGVWTVEGFMLGIENEQGELEAKVISMGDTTLQTLMTALEEHSPSKATNEMGVNLVQGLKNGVTDSTTVTTLMTNVKSLASAVLSNFRLKLNQSNFYEIGTNCMKGLKNGITDKIGEITDAAVEAAQAAITGAKNALQINSPSKVFTEIGEYAGEGLAIGISSYSDAVSTAASGIAEDSITAINNTIAGIADAIEEGLDTTPTIRPVMDLSEIQNGARELNSMWTGFDAAAGLTWNLANQTANSISSAEKRRWSQPSTADAIDKLRVDISGRTASGDQSVVNYFTINGTNAKEIANEVSKKIQRDVERRSLAWGQ